jgi:TPP-dependent trihydroxycyclohexane-1,2-dione (THcHDO) dehydratase
MMTVRLKCGNVAQISDRAHDLFTRSITAAATCRDYSRLPFAPPAGRRKGAAYARADEEVRSFIETTGIPFLPMSMAKGLLTDDHPQSAAAARSYAIGNADVVMLAGARLNWLLSHGRPPLWSESTRLVQVDISPTIVPESLELMS